MICSLFPLKLAAPIVFSVPSASFALSISPANDKVACCDFSPPVSYTRTTYSSELSAFLSALIITLRLSEVAKENSLPNVPLCFVVWNAFRRWFISSAFSTVDA